MNAFRNELQGLVAKHVSLAPAPRLLQLVDFLTGEQPVLNTMIETGEAGAQRFVKLGADGLPTNGAHVAIYDTATDLTWLAEPVGGGTEYAWTDALAAAAAVRLFDATDWRAPTIKDLLSIVDYERYDPAVDTEYFKGPYGWTWSSTPAKEPSGCAWYIYLNYGLSDRYNQSLRLHVRAVRAGQSFALGI